MCVCPCMYACSHLTKKLPKITAVHLRLISGNGDTASYHRRICIRNLVSQTNQAGEGQHYTVLTYVCDTLVRFMTMEVMLPEKKNIMLLLLQDGGVNH